MTQLYQFISLFFGEILYYVLLLFVLEKLVRGKKSVALQFVLSVAITWSIVYVIKQLVPMPRPYVVWDLPMLTTNVSPYSSFPSGHAAVSMTIAVMSWLVGDPVKRALLFLAFCVMAGRVMLFVHFPFDALVGATIGAVVAWGVKRLSLDKKLNMR
ncbi:hypothetical protein CO180_04210 [candidate division WWE3 bacterium CG_4_9_14_3_um_filter_41_6]|uniref:Phosphatidic acid phosphatase type 2/haloperoxidase domain-containing protein n=1 Tax=candidate division WWE3 bacterium CG_4_10_14_0_2_um_filter_41_14 TaxID=1975072 RepID=A0A2M7TK30_UNCKA|nr:MAG: hypothetical protein COY32_02305 [candidate division WWE3 bacterium CG_4_10_14_0_2_um_filter_41_14]PJA38147.1 MAG: hypothetical protein CO180_04210 [candidate division WWE3 bacterium CG_4_9_14_3_um_filter_41_6]